MRARRVVLSLEKIYVLEGGEGGRSVEHQILLNF